MGSGSWSPDDFATRTSTLKSEPVHKVFSGTSMKSDLDPKNFAFRESRDSVDHPKSTAMIFACDVTGSMGEYAKAIAVDSLGKLFSEVLDRKPISDPQLMFMGVGDVAATDLAPFQVSQFESDNRILDQLTDLYIEGGGGGNYSESYTLPWYFAAMRTTTDCFEKRGQKGYLFTSGDECCPDILTAAQLRKVFGPGEYRNYSSAELFEMASKMYHIFHVVIKQGSHCVHSFDRVKESWKSILPQNTIILEDHTKLAEVIVSTIQIIEGEDRDKVVGSWSKETALVVNSATRDLAKSGESSTSDLVRL